jgi:hypothetical protein
MAAGTTEAAGTLGESTMFGAVTTTVAFLGAVAVESLVFTAIALCHQFLSAEVFSRVPTLILTRSELLSIAKFPSVDSNHD